MKLIKMNERTPIFPDEVQNSCKLMASHGAFRLGAWHLLEHVEASQHVADLGPQALREHFGQDIDCLCAHLNHLLANSQLVKDRLPLTVATLFDKLVDGVILCALANAIKPGTIADGVVFTLPMTDAQTRRNLNTAICSLETLGVCVTGLTAHCLSRTEPKVYIGILFQALRRCLLPSPADEAAVVRWVRENSGCSAETTADLPEAVNNPTSYAQLLAAAFKDAPTSPDLKIHNEVVIGQNNLDGAQMVVQNAAYRGLVGLIAPEHLTASEEPATTDVAALQRRRALRLLFMARLYRKQATTLAASSQELQTSLQKTLTMWINSLGIEPDVSRFDTDLRNGFVLLQVWEVLSPGSVNWSSAILPSSLQANAKDHERCAGTDTDAIWLPNCIQVVECARLHGISVEMSASEGLVAGDKLTTEALVLNMMRLHSMMQLNRAIDTSDIASPASVVADVINWSNTLMFAFGANFQLVGADDPNLKATNVLGYLGERVLAQAGRLVPVTLSVSFIASGSGAAVARVGTGSGLRAATARSPSLQAKKASARVSAILDSSNANTDVPLQNNSAKKGSKTATSKDTAEDEDEGEASVRKTLGPVGKGKKGQGAKGKKGPSPAEDEADDEETPEEPPKKTHGPVGKGKKGQGAKGKKGPVPAPYEADDEEAPAEPTRKSQSLGGKGKTGKGAKGKKDPAPAAYEADDEEAPAEPIRKSQSLGGKGKKGQGAKGKKGPAPATYEAEDEEAPEEPQKKTPSPGVKWKKGQGAKGKKGPASATYEADDEEAPEEPQKKTPSPVVKWKKEQGAKGKKGPAPAIDEFDDEEAPQEPPKKTPSPVVKGKKGQGAKGKKGPAPAIDEADDEEAPAEPIRKSQSPGGKGKKGQGAKGKKGPANAADAAEDEETLEEPSTNSPGVACKGRNGRKSKKSSECAIEEPVEEKVARKSKNKGPRAKNWNASVRVKRPLVPSSSNSSMDQHRPIFLRVAQLTMGEQAAEYSRLTLELFRQCGVTVLTDQLGPETDAGVYLDVLLQLKSACVLSLKHRNK